MATHGTRWASERAVSGPFGSEVVVVPVARSDANVRLSKKPSTVDHWQTVRKVRFPRNDARFGAKGPFPSSDKSS